MTHWKTTAVKVIRVKKIKNNDKKRKALYLSVNVFSTKVLTGNRQYFYVSYWRRDLHVTWSSERHEGLAICSRAKVIPSLISHFKTLSIGPTPGIKPATSRSAVKCSTD